MIKTSETHPLRIDSLSVPHVDGLIGLTFCPGKKGQGLFSGSWNRDLNQDLIAIKNWGAETLISLIESHEFELLGVHDLEEQVGKIGLEWFHLPVVDVSIPDGRFESAWERVGNQVRGILCRGGKVVLHCRGGLGRTGVVAARLLTEFGLSAEDAISHVRRARPGTVETREQEQYIHDFHAQQPRRTLDHYLGCLLGGAVGDALGASVEFDSFADIHKQFGPAGIRNYSEAFGRIGAITDDTQMTLFTAEGLLRACSRANAKGIGPAFTSVTYYAYQRWLLTQGEEANEVVFKDSWLLNRPELHSRRAPGNTCLATLKAGVQYRLGSQSPNLSKGCGAVMRTAPVGLFLQSPYICTIWDVAQRDEQSWAVGRDLGYLTHGHPSGYLPAAFLAMIIGRIIDGDGLDAALDKTYETLIAHHYADETMAAITKAREFAADPTQKTSAQTIEKLGEGWVGEEALAIAIYCALVAGDDFDFGIRLAVNHGGDSDSTGAITGNILGALLGRKAISENWIEPLELRGVIEQMATDLFLGWQEGDPWWERYPGY